MSISQLEQAIQDLIVELYCKVYKPRIIVREIKDKKEVIGYTLVLSLNNREKALTISSDGTPEQFLKRVREELRSRRLDSVDYYNGYQLDPDKEREKYE